MHRADGSLLLFCGFINGLRPVLAGLFEAMPLLLNDRLNPIICSGSYSEAISDAIKGRHIVTIGIALNRF